MASRQIEFYESGQILAYDRAHSIDERGMLIRLQFSRKQKWRKLFTDVQPSSASEFDREWRIVAERAKS